MVSTPLISDDYITIMVLYDFDINSMLLIYVIFFILRLVISLQNMLFVFIYAVCFVVYGANGKPQEKPNVNTFDFIF